MTRTDTLVAVLPSVQDDRSVVARPAAETEANPEPKRRVPSLGVLETRPLTDEEREEAWASFNWYAMHGGC